MEDVPKIKGLAFIEALKWYATTHGQDRLVAATKGLAPHLAVFITSTTSPSLGLLPGSWYPSELINHVFSALSRGMTPIQTQQLAASFAQAAIGNTLKGMYATLMRALVSPQMIGTHFQKIWRLYQSTGVCEVTTLAKNRQELRISDWGGHTPFFCQMVRFSARNVLEVSGCVGVESAIAGCVSRGAPCCTYVLSWIET